MRKIPLSLIGCISQYLSQLTVSVCLSLSLSLFVCLSIFLPVCLHLSLSLSLSATVSPSLFLSLSLIFMIMKTRLYFKHYYIFLFCTPAACVGGGIILAALGLALGAGLIGASVIIVPGYGIFRLRKHMWRKRQRKMFEDRRVAVMENLFTNMVAREAALRPLWGLEAGQYLFQKNTNKLASTVRTKIIFGRH